MNDNVTKLNVVKEDQPEPRAFVFDYADRESHEVTGFLICTPSFIAVGTLDGTILFVQPINSTFLRVREKTPTTVFKVADEITSAA